MKKILSILFIISALVALCSPVGVSAATDEVGQIHLSVFTDKTEYFSNESIGISFHISNASPFDIKGASVNVLLQNGITATDGEMKSIDVHPYKTYSASLSAQLSESVSYDGTVNPPTSDNVIYIIILCAVSSLALVFLLKGRGAFRVLSIAVCAVVIFSAVPFDAFATEGQYAMLCDTAEFTVDGQKYSLRVEFTYPIQEKGAYISEEIAKMFGVSPYEYDTDNDGLSNYIEIYITSTHPDMVDTDNNGISDAYEDADKDGIPNIDELNIGTNMAKADTDGDGLADYDEINVYNTLACDFDTDGDGLCDGDEIALGLHPKKAKTDGQIFDSQRKILQRLDVSNIEDGLLADNKAVPSLTLNAKGNINRNTTVDVISPVGFSDSRAIIGKTVKISGDDVSDGTLTFTLCDVDLSKGEYNTLSICRYNSDNTVEYLDTEIDVSANTLSTHITDCGIYFVFDMGNMLNELGLSLPTFNTLNTVQQTTVMADENTQLTDESGVMAQADIVFVIDSTASMQDEINNVKNNISSFVDALKDRGVSAALSLVDYQDITVDGLSSTRVHTYDSSHWFYDVQAYKDALSSITLGYGGDLPECAVDALESARLLDMRASAGKIFILVTDAPYKNDNRYGIPSMEAEIELLVNAGVNCCVISPRKLYGTYYDLYSETNGVWENISVDFHENLLSLAETIGDSIVGDGYWIYLDGPVPVPVRLDAPLQEGSDTDTDKDGIPDVEELEGVVPSGEVDLDALISQISGGMITGTNYGKVPTYKYSSDPTLPDTDFDGTEDLQDTMPASNENVGIMHYVEGSAKTCEVAFTVDYRQLIEGDNTVYSKSLSVLSSLYASDVYDELYIEITNGAITGGDDTPTTFGTMLGLEDSKYIGVKSTQYSVDKDDITDFYIGHRKIVYNGVENEVIVLIVRGTNGTNAEWSSNFDVGADTTGYYDKTGSHPHWIDKNNHKGFDVTANRVIEKALAYMKTHVDQDAKQNILIAGHSRGAAIANVIGKYFEDDERYNSYTYTFATPNSTTASNAASYKTIFNLVNEDDIITYLPMKEWGFTNYGTIRSISIRNNYTGSKAGTWEKFTGVSYNDDGGTQRTLDCFGAIVTKREELYELDMTSDGKVWENNLGHLTKGGAEKELTTLSAELENEKLLRFCNVYVVGGGIMWHVEIHYCPAYFMQTLANMTTSTGPLLGRDVKGKYATAKTSFVASSGMVVIGGMTHPHMQPTYYYIADKNFQPL